MCILYLIMILFGQHICGDYVARLVKYETLLLFTLHVHCGPFN